MKGTLLIAIILSLAAPAEAAKRKKRKPASSELSSVSSSQGKKRSKKGSFISRISPAFGFSMDSLAGADATQKVDGNSQKVGATLDFGGGRFVGETGLFFVTGKWEINGTQQATSAESSEVPTENPEAVSGAEAPASDEVLPQRVRYYGLEIPVAGKFYFLGKPKGTAMYAKAGVAMQYILSSQYEFEDQSMPKYFPKIESGATGFNGAVGLGGRIGMHPKYALLIEAQYTRGLTTIGGRNLTPSGLGALLGFSINL